MRNEADLWPDIMCTAHRDLTAAQARHVRNELIRVVTKLRDEHGATTAHCGLAYGGDTHFGYTALADRLDLHAHVPFPQQADRWSDRRLADWRYLWTHRSAATVYGDLDRHDNPHAEAVRLYHARNQGMVAAATAAVAIWDGRRTGGAWHAVRLIHKAKMPVVWIRPNGEPTLSRIPDELFATVPR